MRRPTRQPFRGRLLRLDEMSEVIRPDAARAVAAACDYLRAVKIAARRWACARSPSQARCAAANASASGKTCDAICSAATRAKISRRRSVRSPILLEPNTAQTVAITLHELATNAAKYGALSVPNGHVDLKWSHQGDGRLHMRWTETGGPKVQNRRARVLVDGSLNK